MRVIVAPDGFKDSLAAKEVAAAMRLGVMKFDPGSACYEIPLSDGGDGFLQAIRNSIPTCNAILADTQDPLGRPMRAPYLLDATTGTAYIELAQASGIELLSKDERDVMHTSTYGTGVQMVHAISNGATQLYIGLGGSATNDAGTGMAAAMGYEFLDRDGQAVHPSGGNLASISSIQEPEQGPAIPIYAINDVANPLYGAEGAAHVYSRQKGASEQQVIALDKGLQQLDKIVVSSMGIQASTLKGAGAAGGSGYGLHTFLKARFVSGTQFILGLSPFHSLLKKHTIDLIITGEGKIDHQTAFGKVVHGLIEEGAAHGIPVAAICGKLELSREEVRELGLVTAKELYRPGMPPGYSYEHAARLIAERAMAICAEISSSLTG